MAWPLDLFQPTPTPEQVRRELQRIVSSPEFTRAARLREILEFIVGRRLEGREDQLTGYGIAAGVFERDVSFDPDTDSIVRTEVARLRRRLEQYYAGSGARDRIRIILPRGDYVPVLRMEDRRVPWDWLVKAPRAVVVGVLAMLAIIAGVMVWSIL